MGSDEERNLQSNLKDQGIAHDEVQPKSELKKTNRNISCFLQGLINIIADLLCGKGIATAKAVRTLCEAHLPLHPEDSRTD
jgi:hypothetical protein